MDIIQIKTTKSPSFKYIIIHGWKNNKYVTDTIIDQKSIETTTVAIVKHGKTLISVPCQKILNDMENNKEDDITQNFVLPKYSQHLNGNWVNLHCTLYFRRFLHLSINNVRREDINVNINIPYTLILDCVILKETITKSYINRAYLKLFKANPSEIPDYISDALFLNDSHYLHHIINEDNYCFLIQYSKETNQKIYAKILADFHPDDITPENKKLLLKFYDTYHSTPIHNLISINIYPNGIRHSFKTIQDKSSTNIQELFFASVIFNYKKKPYKNYVWKFNWNLMSSICNTPQYL